MERETVDRLARATGCQVVNNVIGNPMFTMTTHELQLFAEKIVEIVALESMEVTKTFTSKQGLDYSAPVALARHFGVKQ